MLFFSLGLNRIEWVVSADKELPYEPSLLLSAKDDGSWLSWLFRFEANVVLY
jgi:hypothetical protein